MTRHDRTDFYRSNRDYARLLGDQEVGEEEEYEDEYNYRPQNSGRKKAQLDNPLNQEYLERRQKFKELEREKLRGKLSAASGINGRVPARNGTTNNHASDRKHLPYDNYGSFFGPSEPVVANRIIEEARAREEAEVLVSRTVRDTSEHQSTKIRSEAPRSAPAARVTEMEKQSKVVNEAAMKLQRLKEARDYSFLFTDEDPTSTQQDVEPIKSKNSDKIKPKSTNPEVGKIRSTEQKLPTTSKPSSAGNVSKTNAANMHKAPAQKMHSHVPDRVSKPSARPTVTKPKISSESGLNSGKKASGPGRPSDANISISKAGTGDGKNYATPSGTLPKKVAVMGNTAASVQSRKGQSPSQSRFSNATVRPKVVSAPQKAVPAGNFERKNAAPNGQKQPLSAGRMAPGYPDQRRPVQHVGPSKQVVKTTMKSNDSRRFHKRPMDSDSEDSFLDDDDDDDGGGNVSSIIQKMFGYNPNKYRSIDEEDDRNMEADFRTIQMEERRSTRLAREEDERELALIEEEERAERARKDAKRRKLNRR